MPDDAESPPEVRVSTLLQYAERLGVKRLIGAPDEIQGDEHEPDHGDVAADRPSTS